MRWIVGDVQGCARELDELLRVIRFDAEHDELYVLGDFINRGPDSLAALRLWASVGGQGIIGNHEVYALLAESGRWPRQGDTLQELYAAPDGAALLERLRQLPLLRYLDDRTGGEPTWLVHAGLDPRWHNLFDVAERVNGAAHDDLWLLSPEVSFATRVRCCTDTGDRSRYDREPEQCPPPYRPWDEFYRGTVRVVHGHWARRGYYRRGRVLGLDSGCVYGGSLTAWCQEEDRIVQVPARHA